MINRRFVTVSASFGLVCSNCLLSDAAVSLLLAALAATATVGAWSCCPAGDPATDDKRNTTTINLFMATECNDVNNNSSNTLR